MSVDLMSRGFRKALLMFACCGCVYGQHNGDLRADFSHGLTADDGSLYERRIKSLFGAMDDAFKASSRCTLLLRILPMSRPESQIAIEYDVQGQVTVTTKHLARSLRNAISGHVPPLYPLFKDFGLSVQSFRAEPSAAEDWVDSGLQSLADSLKIVGKEAFPKLKNGEVVIALDPAIYQFIFYDGFNHFSAEFQGPEPNQVEHTSGTLPVVIWSAALEELLDRYRDLNKR